jgi:N-glycosylase/DNA lyase
MELIQHQNDVEIAGIGDFDPVRIFECGQCFRWRAEGDGAYIGVAYGRVARVRYENGSLYISGTVEDVSAVWRGYFDLDRDYAEIRRRLSVDAYMARAAEHGAGIRILRQEPWEALCSFIISQCNNIPRITQIIETLCRLYGEPLVFEGRTYYAFPTAGSIARLTADNLVPLRCGYRAPYIINAARAVSSAALDLEALKNAPPEEALAALKRLDGVGDKVAHCALLFGLHKLDMFPVDTWVRKALSENYDGKLDIGLFSPYAGIAQQYIFYYARCGGNDAGVCLRQ